MSADSHTKKRKYQQDPAATPQYIPCGLWCSISKSIWTLAWIWLPLYALPVSCPTNGPVPWNGSRLLCAASSSSSISGARNPWALRRVSTKSLVFKYIFLWKFIYLVGLASAAKIQFPNERVSVLEQSLSCAVKWEVSWHIDYSIFKLYKQKYYVYVCLFIPSPPSSSGVRFPTIIFYNMFTFNFLQFSNSLNLIILQTVPPSGLRRRILWRWRR